MFNLTWFDDCCFLFLYTYFSNVSISNISTSPVATVGIGELTPSKFKYETLQLSRDLIKFSECQVPLRKFVRLIQDFLDTVLVFKLHIYSRDSLAAFDSYQSEKLRNTRIVNLTVTTIWVRLTWRFLLCAWDFYSRGKRVATWSWRRALKSLCR